MFVPLYVTVEGGVECQANASAYHNVFALLLFHTFFEIYPFCCFTSSTTIFLLHHSKAEIPSV
jgi:hypothetical protein